MVTAIITVTVLFAALFFVLILPKLQANKANKSSAEKVNDIAKTKA